MSAKTARLLKATILLVVGILLCLSIINASQFLNWIFSIAMVVMGAALIAVSLVSTKALFTDTGILGGLILSLGVFCIPGIGFIDFFGIISVAMMVVGCLLLVDGFLGFALKRSNAANVIELILGAGLFAIGICLWLLADFRKFAGMMLGIFMMVYAVVLFVETVTNKALFSIKKTKSTTKIKTTKSK